MASARLAARIKRDHPSWSDRRIAEVCGVHHGTVSTIHKQLSESDTSPPADPPTRTGRDGNWLPWLKANVEFSHDKASRYIALFKRRDEISHNAKFGVTAAYRLLAPPKADAAKRQDEGKGADGSGGRGKQKNLTQTIGEGIDDRHANEADDLTFKMWGVIVCTFRLTSRT